MIGKFERDFSNHWKILLVVFFIANFATAEPSLEPVPLTLDQAMMMSSSQNVDLAVKKAETRAAIQDAKKASSLFLPQVSGNAQYYRIDEDRADVSMGGQPEDRSTIGLGVNQVLFDDSVYSGYKASARVREQARLAEQSARNDILSAGGIRFLDYLSAQVLRKIDEENVVLTRENLQQAIIRRDAGAASPEEVYRWEVQESLQSSQLIAAESRVEQSLYALNRVLGARQSAVWDAKPVDLKSAEVQYFVDAMGGLSRESARIALLEDFAVQEAFQNSPLIKSLEEAVEAQRIEWNRQRRSRYVPSVGAGFTFDHIIDETVSDVSWADFGESLATEPADDDEWMASVRASIPLFEGGGRKAEIERAAANLDRSQQILESARQQVEVEVRSAVQAVCSAYASLDLTQKAVDRANKNLDIIQQKYDSGTLSILFLLDAQNQLKVQEQTAVIAVHTYLKSLLDFQRAIGWFRVLADEKSRMDWSRRCSAYLEKQAPEGL